MKIDPRIGDVLREAFKEKSKGRPSGRTASRKAPKSSKSSPVKLDDDRKVRDSN